MHRSFLFLQGPHGPFFSGLAQALQAEGATVHRVLFNRGDRLFCAPRLSATRYRHSPDDWPGEMAALCGERAITDIVLYGDTRPHHAQAVEVARRLGLRVHVFEEGYLRPWWVTYERGGANGHSPLNDLALDQIDAMLVATPPVVQEAPEGWGALRRHMAYGALYHAAVLTGGARMPSHRDVAVSREALLHLRKLLLTPFTAIAGRRSLRRLRRGAGPYHLVLLQLDHDANFRNHSPFPGTEAFLDHVLGAFAKDAPAQDRIAFRMHPLEDGRVPLRTLVRDLARKHGVARRVVLLGGGRLGPVLDGARTVVTVNSTAAQQALFRALPVKALGHAIYSREGFVSRQSLGEFFRDPEGPDHAVYLRFRDFLLATSQLTGSYYTWGGRRQLYRKLPAIMLDDADRYVRLAPEGAAGPQHPDSASNSNCVNSGDRGQSALTNS